MTSVWMFDCLKHIIHFSTKNSNLQMFKHLNTHAIGKKNETFKDAIIEATQFSCSRVSLLSNRTGFTKEVNCKSDSQDAISNPSSSIASLLHSPMKVPAGYSLRLSMTTDSSLWPTGNHGSWGHVFNRIFEQHAWPEIDQSKGPPMNQSANCHTDNEHCHQNFSTQ